MPESAPTGVLATCRGNSLPIMSAPIDSERQLLQEGEALRRLARSLLGNGADADDLVQDTFAASLASPRSDAGARPWLRATLRNLALLWRRTTMRRTARERLAAQAERQTACDPAAIAAQSELLRCVVTAVHELEEPFRSVVVLRFWRGLLPEAIARELGVPHNTVRSRLQRGLERLRARLDGRHGERAKWSAPLATAVGLDPPAATVATVTLAAGIAMKTKLFVGAAALALAALLVTLVARQPAGVPPPDASPSPPVAATGTIDRDATAPEVQRQELATAKTTDTASGELVVLVRDAATQAPVAGAKVFGHRSPDPYLNRTGDLGAMNGAYGVARYCQRLYTAELELGTTGPDGIAHVSPRVRDDYLLAQGPDCLGIAFASTTARQVTIDLSPDRCVTVRAVDAQGRPVAGLPIGARCLDLGLDQRVMANPGALGVTDAAGELPCHLRAQLEGNLRASSTVFLVPFLPGRWQQGGTAVDLDHVLPEHLVVQVPPLGSLCCEWLDSEGQVRTCPFAVSIDEPGILGDGTREHPDFASLQWNARFQETRGFWPLWGLGLHHEGAFRTGTGGCDLRGDGPRFPGETARIQVRTDPRVPILTGRLLTAEGSPLAMCAVSIRYRAHRNAGTVEVWTDADGRFEWPLRSSDIDTTLDWLLLTPRQQPPAEPPLVCLCTPARKLLPGRLALGDLALAPAPLVLQGRIEADGILARDVQLQVDGATLRADGTLRWENCDQLLLTRTSPEKFCFFGFADAPQLELSVSGHRLAPMPAIPFAPGTKDLVVRAVRGGTIQGTVGGGFADSGNLHLQLVDEATDKELPDLYLQVRTRFETSGLQPGIYTLRLLFEGDPEPLAEVTGVHVQAGATTKDPRLLPIQIAVPPHLLRVTARIDGKPAPEGGVLVLYQEGDCGTFSLLQGLSQVWTRRDAVDLWVCANGFAPMFVAGARGDVQVDLQPPRELLLHLDAPPLPPGFVLQWDFELLHPDPRIPRGRLEYFGHQRRLRPGADGCCRLPILSDQPARVVCHVQRLNSDYWQPVPVTPGELPAGASEVRLSVQPADVQSAMQKLRDRDG